MRPIPTEEFSTLVGSIYECAISPSLWPATLASLRGRMDFANASLDLLAMPTGKVLVNASSGLSEEWVEQGRQYGAEIVDQWGGVERMNGYPLEEPIQMSVVNPPGLTRSNRYYADWGEPHGIIDVVAIALARGTSTLGTVAFSRHVDVGPIGVAELAALRLFIPHLKRAVTTSRLLEARAVEAATYASVLDGLSVGVLLVAPDLRLLHANRAGEALLRSGDPLGLRRGRIIAPASVASALTVALAAPLDGIGRRGLGIPARRRDGEELVLHLLPLSPATALAPAVAAAIFVAPATAPRPTPIAALTALFDLTPSEARVLDLIAAGRTNADIARALGVAMSTVRTHLLRLFDKTRTHRQADLVALVASFSLPIA
jgi:DNA-binding CsgD family transcriptional regulator